MVVRTTILMAALAYSFLPAGAAAQEPDVRASIEATLDAWSAGDFQAFANQYHPDTRGFFLDGGTLVEGINVAALQAGYEAGIKAELSIRELDTTLYGEAAVTVAFLEGSLTLPGGNVQPGTWRYTETRVREGGVWKVVQYHFSEMAAAPR